MQEYLKAGFQTNESEEILFSGRRKEVGVEAAAPDLIKEIKWPYTFDSKEQSPWGIPNPAGTNKVHNITPVI